MPQINLLSSTLSKKPKQVKNFDLPKVDVLSLFRPVFTATIPLLAIFIVISLVLFVFAGKKSSDLAKLTEKEKGLVVDPQELVKLNQRKSALQKKIALLSELSSQNFYLVDKLNDINDCLPNGVWFSQISLEQRKAAPVSSGTTVKMEDAVDRVGHRFLTIKGSAIAPQIDDAVSFIGEFVNTLKQKTAFSQDFAEIKLNAIYKSSIGKTDVMNFELVCF
jgi:hypothetical protein